MQKHLKTALLLATGAALLSGCASYRAAPLSNLSSEVVYSTQTPKNNDILVTARAFDKVDCKRYLDRNVISRGYQPIQLYIQNNSDHRYSFALNRIDLPYARQDEVARKVHTSTVGRVLGYGVPGLIVFLPLLIPAVVDGMKSSEANDALDDDFSSKVARDQTINPHSHFNKIIFVPVSDYQNSFNLTLVDQESNTPRTFQVSTT